MKQKNKNIIAIIGRPNVGKSTLFNRLAGKRLALVHDKPGMTRDRREAPGKLFDLSFTLFDTAGLIDPDTPEISQELYDAMQRQTKKGLQEATLILFMIDAREGCTPYDQELAQMIRQVRKPTIVLANKCEGNHGDGGYADALGLGLGEVISFSAEHGLGLSELYDALEPLLEKEEESEEEPENERRPIKITIIGRPNAGKSTLINRLIKEERLLTADQPGVTRDSITLDWEFKNRPIQLIDTAGMRKRGKVKDVAEKLAVMDARRTIRFTEVVILLVDAAHPFEKQDLTLAQQVIEEGRTLILAVNKIDTVKDPKKLLKTIGEMLEESLAQVKDIPCVPISALSGFGLNNLMEEVLSLYAIWNTRISTAKINEWLRYLLDHHPPPIAQGRRIKIKYMTQIKTRPPTFALFLTKATELPESYQRYMINNLRKDFGLKGVPIRLVLRSSQNPYA